MILFYYALGAKSQFHLVVFLCVCVCSFFVCARYGEKYYKKKICTETKSYYNIISISDTNDVSISMKYSSL